MYKLFIFLISLTLITTGQAAAQRHRKGQYGLTIQGGIVDRIPGISNHSGEAVWTADQQGLLGSLQFHRFTRNEHFWIVGVQYDRKFYWDGGQKLTSDRYISSFAYAPFSIHNYKRGFYLSPYIGALAGIERVNNDQLDINSGRIGVSSGFSLGPLVGLELEIFLTKNLSLVSQIEERFYLFSSLNKFHTQGSLGVRYTFSTQR